MVRQITRGDWIVESIKSIDEENGVVYFSGRADTPLESHLYSAKLFEKSQPRRLTEKDKFHSVVMAKDNKTFIDRSSSVNQPAQVALRDNLGNFLTWLEPNRLDNKHP